MILLCSMVGNAVGCDSNTKLDSTRPFGFSDWKKSSSLFNINEQSGKIFLLKIAKDPSLSLEKNRNLIYELTRIPGIFSFNLNWKQQFSQRRYGLKVGIKNGRFDLANLLVKSYDDLIVYPFSSISLADLLKNEKTFIKVKSDELIVFTNKFLHGTGHRYPDIFSEDQKQNSIVANCIIEHNKKVKK